MPTQPPGVGVTDVVDPALHAGIEFGKADLSAFVEVDIMLQAVGEVHGVAALESAVRGVNDEAEPGDTLLAARDLRLTFMRGQAQGCQSFSAAPRVRVVDRLLEIERCVEQPPCASTASPMWHARWVLPSLIKVPLQSRSVGAVSHIKILMFLTTTSSTNGYAIESTVKIPLADSELDSRAV